MSRCLLREPDRRPDSRRAARRASNTVAVRATAHMDAVPASADDYWHDLRRGRRWVWGGLLRFIDRCREIGTPLGVVLLAIRAVEWYARDVYGTAGLPEPAT
jgi:hypothetical protein